MELLFGWFVIDRDASARRLKEARRAFALKTQGWWVRLRREPDAIRRLDPDLRERPDESQQQHTEREHTDRQSPES